MSSPTIEDVLSDPASSNWLKVALQTALDRDPVDALIDADILSAVLQDRLNRLLHPG